jgi:hypothetical protein
MIPIENFTALWQYISASVPGIDQFMVVHEESDLALIIREISDGAVLLIAVLPSADAQSDSVDNYHETDTCFVFVVKKSDRGSLTQDEYLSQLSHTQKIMASLKQQLLALASDTDHSTNHSHLFHGLIISSMHTDPEYNLLGCNGWGLSFKVKTQGFTFK